MRHRSLVVPLSLMLTAWVPSVAGAQAGRARFDQGMRLMVLEQPRGAETRFEQAVEAEPGVAEYHYWLGRSVGMQAARASKIKLPFLARRIKAEFERAVALDSTMVDPRDGLVIFYLLAPRIMGGSPAKAREQQRAIARIDAMRGHQASAWIAWHGRDTAATEAAFREALAAAPDSARPVLGLAVRQIAWRRTDDAFATLSEFLARHPHDISVRFALGRLSAMSGEELARGEAALRGLLAEPEWRSSIEEPTRAAVHYRLGTILEKSGRHPDARTSYEEALKLEPTLRPAQVALAKLK